MITLDNIKENRLSTQVHLVPANGSLLQAPTFKGMNAASYIDPGTGKAVLILDTEQSMANRLESTIVLNPESPDPADALTPDLKGLPYMVSLLPDGESYAVSLLECHRMADAYFGSYGATKILNKEAGQQEKKGKTKVAVKKEANKAEVKTSQAKSQKDVPLPEPPEGHVSFLAFWKGFLEEIGYSQFKPVDYNKVYRQLFRYDPNSLLHGVWLAGLMGGRIRVSRAMSVEMRANGFRPVELGGVKADRCSTSNNVPYPRTRYVADDIVAYAMVDLDQIRGYRLPSAAENLLLNLSLLKLSRFFYGGIRLRTDCALDLADSGIAFTRPHDMGLPREDDLISDIQGLIRQCTKDGLFAVPPVTRLVAPLDVNKKEKGKTLDESAEAGSEDSAIEADEA